MSSSYACDGAPRYSCVNAPAAVCCEITLEGVTAYCRWEPTGCQKALQTCKQLCHKTTMPDPILVCLRLLDTGVTKCKVRTGLLYYFFTDAGRLNLA